MDWRTTRSQRMSPAQILQATGQRGPPLWPDDLAVELGVAVYRVREYRGWSAALRFHQTEAHLWFYLHEHAGRDNFFVAFELGRLHHSPPGVYADQDLRRRTSHDRASYRFAEELLMPVPWLRYYGPGVHYDIGQLADLFVAEREAMVVRAIAAGPAHCVAPSSKQGIPSAVQ